MLLVPQSSPPVPLVFRSRSDRTRPAGIRYATFRLDDGVSFVHVASNETEHGHSPLGEVKAFQEFVAATGRAYEYLGFTGKNGHVAVRML